MIKRILLRKLLPFLASQVDPIIQTVTDETGTFIRLELWVMGKRIFNRRVYLKRGSAGDIPDQTIKINNSNEKIL